MTNILLFLSGALFVRAWDNFLEDNYKLAALDMFWVIISFYIIYNLTP